MFLPYTFLSLILTQTFIFNGTSTPVTLTTRPSLLYAATFVCPKTNVTKSNIAVGPFTQETVSLPCSPKEVLLKVTLTYFLFYMKEKTTITFATAVGTGTFKPQGTVTITMPPINVTLDDLATLIARPGKVVVAFQGVPKPPLVAVGAVALGGLLKRRSRKPSPQR